MSDDVTFMLRVSDDLPPDPTWEEHQAARAAQHKIDRVRRREEKREGAAQIERLRAPYREKTGVELSIRTLNCLLNEGLETLDAVMAQVASRSIKEWFAIPNFGKVSYRELMLLGAPPLQMRCSCCGQLVPAK